MHVCQMSWGLLSNACIIVLTLWTIRRESPFAQAVSDLPREQKDLRSVSMPTASWVFMRAAGLFWIAMDYQIEMKDSYLNTKTPGTVWAWRFSLCFSFLFASELGFCSFGLCLLVWLPCPCTTFSDPGQLVQSPQPQQQVLGSNWTPRRKLLPCHSEPARFAGLGETWAGSTERSLALCLALPPLLPAKPSLAQIPLQREKAKMIWKAELWDSKTVRMGWN